MSKQKPTKIMIDKNKYQCWQHPNELLLIANNKCQFHEQKVNHF